MWTHMCVCVSVCVSVCIQVGVIEKEKKREADSEE